MAEFTKIVPASCLRGSGLLLTPEFRDSVVPETGTYTLQNAEGKQTTCTITRKAQGAHERCDIHGGWRQFARDNAIKEGDEIRIRHLGGRVIEITKTGRTGTPGRTPAKTPKAKTPGRSRASGAGSKTPGTADGGVAKRRGSSSAKKVRATAAAGQAAGTPASPASGRRGRRSSQGGGSAARATKAAAPAEDDWQEQQEQAAGSGGWCSIM